MKHVSVITTGETARRSKAILKDVLDCFSTFAMTKTVVVE
jgi:hypothetical protein